MATFHHLVNHYQSWIVPRLAPRTQRDKAQNIKRLLKAFGNLDATHITPAQVQKYVWHRQTQSPTQARHELNTLNQVFKWGIRFGLIDCPNPCLNIQRPIISPRDRYVSDDELRLFVQVNPEWGGWIALLAYSTGLRLGDLLALRFHSDGLEVKTRKTGRWGTIAMTKSLFRIIQGLKPSIREGAHILTQIDGLPFSSDSFHGRWQRCMRRYVDAGGVRFHLHDLRAKFLTDSKSQGLDPQAQALHCDSRTTEIYLRSRERIQIQPMEWINEQV